ncbi:putative ABC transporter ATP-binding protein YadG [BD1-7 clade bacterium]|uniref:Putative ABC transporter ATP-binding protein YadG n=1 Tax=BD1-7 clade bacterium TaxID=2029982 RepID=A0A5S9Q2N7_9GAMM|nr:putative ABC transporter ATP-binding protein YadG [BD1-7 clade bacterium]CAA0112009.1 putative ABC transporter ATP-binding protein YadG [BD1-7 clade bacterium]
MTVAVSIKNLSKTYAGGHQALRGIDLDVQKGDFFALLGPNGAGKSTTIGILNSLVIKTSGEVQIFGIDIDRHFSKAKSMIGVVPQEFNFNQFEKVRNILTIQAGYYGISARAARHRADQLLRDLGLWDKRDVPSKMLSGGMKRRLMIARALIHEPKLLILDEPTAGVDIEMRRSMWEFLQKVNEQGTTIILTTHYLEEAESLCRNIAIIDHGTIVQHSSMKDLLKELQEETFIFDVQGSLPGDFAIDGFKLELMDDHCFAVAVHKDQNLNDVFSAISGQGIEVRSMRNKANRLEELFVKLVNGE